MPAHWSRNIYEMASNQMTIVLTHGWIPLNPLTLYLTPLFSPNGIDDWPIRMAAELHAQNPTANIVAWNWRDAATSPLVNPQGAGGQTPQEGASLGLALLNTLRPNYSKQIQFIGHSFGTLVNAYAANFLQGNKWHDEPISPTPWPANNMLMTLFDEAEIGADIHFIPSSADLAALVAALQGQSGSLPPYYHPLPKEFAWAENYISEFGLPHDNAANVILKVGSPANAPDPKTWFLDLGSFHVYPVAWYEPTIQTWNSAMGFVWPYLWSLGDPSFANAPASGSLYVQADAGNPYNLTLQNNWNGEVGSLIARLESYGTGLGSSFAQFANNTLTANGAITPQAGLDLNAIDSVDWLFNINTSPANPGASSSGPHPRGGPPGGSGSNVPAYAWMQLIIPTNAVSMSFNFLIQGDWQSDSLAAALNGTNVLFLAGSDIETSMPFNSGAIDVSAYAGQTNEFFIGIVGGTSTNAQLMVENLSFSILSAPALQAQAAGGNLTLLWPLSAQDFSLQTTTNLSDPNSWVTLTNVPAIVNLQNTVTNSISGAANFYRLKK